MNIQSTSLLDTAFQKGVDYHEAISALYKIPKCKNYLNKDKPEFKEAVIACLKAGIEVTGLKKLVPGKVTSSPELGTVGNISKKIARPYKKDLKKVPEKREFNTNHSLSAEDKQQLKKDLEDKIEGLDKPFAAMKTTYATEYARFRETKKGEKKDGFFPFIKQLDLGSLEQLKTRFIEAGYTEKDKDGKETNKVVKKVDHAIRNKTAVVAA